MSLDPLLPIAPARVKALLLPVGQISADRFASFVDRLHSEHVVHLRDVTADGRPNRSTTPRATPNRRHWHLLTDNTQTCFRRWPTRTVLCFTTS